MTSRTEWTRSPVSASRTHSAKKSGSGGFPFSSTTSSGRGSRITLPSPYCSALRSSTTFMAEAKSTPMRSANSTVPQAPSVTTKVNGSRGPTPSLVQDSRIPTRETSLTARRPIARASKTGCLLGWCPLGRWPLGWCPSGQCPLGRWPLGWCPSGQGPSGQGPSGQGPLGQWPLGWWCRGLTWFMGKGAEDGSPLQTFRN